MPVAFSSLYSPQSEVILYESADYPHMMLTLPGGREAPGIDSRVRMMVVWCNHLLTRLPDHDDVPAC